MLGVRTSASCAICGSVIGQSTETCTEAVQQVSELARRTHVWRCEMLEASRASRLRSVWAGKPLLPAQTPKKPQETNGMSGTRRSLEALQIGRFPVPVGLS